MACLHDIHVHVVLLPPSFFIGRAIVNVIKKQAINMKEELKSALSEAPSVSVTIDLWSDRTKRGFIGITAHFEANNRLAVKTLTTQRVSGKSLYTI